MSSPWWTILWGPEMWDVANPPTSINESVSWCSPEIVQTRGHPSMKKAETTWTFQSNSFVSVCKIWACSLQSRKKMLSQAIYFQGQVGWGFENPGLVKVSLPMAGRVGTIWSLRSLPTQPILWFCFGVIWRAFSMNYIYRLHLSSVQWTLDCFMLLQALLNLAVQVKYVGITPTLTFRN